MRVISGSARGRRIKEPDGASVRPTTDMVKESIFNIIQFDIEGRKILDLFAGTGQLGIEALSRGAAEAVFVEESSNTYKLVRENVKSVGFEDKATVVPGDALTYLKRAGKFDVIFLDPPYDTKLLDKSLASIIEFDILNENGIIICESNLDKILPEVTAPYKKGREYRYGKIKVTIYSKVSASED